MSQEYEESAGGMSYRTLRGIDISQIRGYLEGRDEAASAEILEKNKEYYLASADKTISRLELAKIRAKNANLTEEEWNLVDENINKGFDWLNDLKKNIIKVEKESDCLKSISYKKWHSVKLIPSSVEGYVITIAINKKINRIKTNLSASAHRMHLRNAEKHNSTSKKIFLELMDLDEYSDLDNAEILRIKAYNEAFSAQDILKAKFNQYPR
jgi:hypothetical protein